MAIYVLDASVVVQRLVRDSYTSNVQALFHAITKSDDLIVPEFCLLECTNVLWKHVRFFGMPETQAVQLIHDLWALPLRRTAVRRLSLINAIQLGLKYQLAIYDSIYVALAKNLNVPLNTVDQPQIRAAAAEGITLKPITDFIP